MNIEPPPADPRIAFFNHLADRWDSQCSHPLETLARLSLLADQLPFRPGRDVLEIGCGTGQLSRWLSRQVAPGRVVGADFSPDMLARARANNPGAEYLHFDICVQPPVPAGFDVVLCFNSFPHFRDKPAALRHMAQALKPGGTLLVLHLAGSQQLNAFHSRLDGPVSQDLLPAHEDWAPLLASAGLMAQRFADTPELFLLQAGA